ncbi:DUF2892 domain-containing protein [Paenibacillus sp. GSMTC-2017]|uniref:YgaP family membrane protein n=1 Tax=Paenibacillus sp. GSMTC-2017 TaxID=2794350 RepID=UPI0018D8A56A|nr:DUF2892 domain-containing protein [Paenibacillus sp. GSMTC-2017]MBH5319553.1 DUF2892 domain-containing protein [Paenibacillus sp. GSMTC-2017]
MKNVGMMERVIRVVGGLALLSLLPLLESGWKWVGLLGIPLVLTGSIGICMMYRMLGKSTCGATR